MVVEKMGESSVAKCVVRFNPFTRPYYGLVPTSCARKARTNKACHVSRFL